MAVNRTCIDKVKEQKLGTIYRPSLPAMPARGHETLSLKATAATARSAPSRKRNFIPGQHGKDRAKKIVGYGLQLREKQKARRVYGVLERQFREHL